MPERSRFIAAEHCYSSLFAHSCRTEYGMRYTDALIPDMYCHNYLRLDTDRIRDFASACEQERSYRTGLGQKTVHIVIDDVRADTLASYVPAAYCKDVIMMAAGVEEVSRLQLPAAPGILIRVAQDPADLEIGAQIDMRAFGDPSGTLPADVSNAGRLSTVILPSPSSISSVPGMGSRWVTVT